MTAAVYHGFLGPTETRFTAHVYLAAMARSGSTLLANLMTQPSNRWVLVEPWFGNGAIGRELLLQAREFGWRFDDREWSLDNSRPKREAIRLRYEQFLLPFLNRLDRWGAKEIRPEFHTPTIAMLRPRQIVVTTRDIRDVYLSLIEKHRRQGRERRYTEEWSMEYCLSASAAVRRLFVDHADRCIVARYEDFAFSVDERRRLEVRLDWPLTGSVDRNLDAFGRSYEIARHARTGRTTATAFEERNLESWVAESSHRVAEVCVDYQKQFGYAP